MEVLSPRSANVPSKPRAEMKKSSKTEGKAKPVPEKPTNPDRIDDKWRPPAVVTEPVTAEKYSTGRKLGKGGFAVCFEGSTNDGKIFALKVVKAKVEQKKMAEKFRTELQIHAKMQHPNIVDFLRAFTADNHTYVVLELCSNGNLTDMVKARACLSLPEVRRFMIQICGGVRYMHKRNVIHRDLKMGNIFLDAHMNIKIGDFGLAAVMADEQDRRTTLCGTPNYIAPEILSKSGTRGHDNKVDTWAVGVICYAMLMGTPPFQSKTQQEIYAKLRTLEYEWKVDSKNYIPDQAKDFVAGCLNLVSTERPEMDDLVEHEFFTMGAIADVLNASCLKNRPEWLLNADPSGDRVRTGYGITHANACRAAGVGRAADGKPRPGVGGKCNTSTLVEIEIENQKGTAPTIPLPEGILYNSFTEAQADWARWQKHPLQPGKPCGRTPKHELDGQTTRSAAMEQVAPQILSGSLPRVVPSFAAQQRQQALPGRTVTRSSRAPADLAPSASDIAKAVPSEGLLRARPVRSASTRTTRTASNHLHASAVPRTIPKSSTLPSSLTSLAEAAAEIAPTASKTERSSTIVVTQQTRAATRLGFSKEDAIGRSQKTGLPFDGTETEISRPASMNERRPRPLTIDENRVLPTVPPPVLHTCHKPRLISVDEPHSLLPNTSATATLTQLHKLHLLLGRPTTSNCQTASRRSRTRSPYPRVDKWVDYSSKHGIAYILTDGTLGMVIKSSDDYTRPSACVAVRNARSHTVLRAKGAVCQLVPQSRNARDVEFYEQNELHLDVKKVAVPSCQFAIDERRYTSITEAATAMQSSLAGSAVERLRELVLLDKFGKYMNKRAAEDNEPEEGFDTDQRSDHFIHFYQRLGNVGVWRFADGGLQFNFPDHTKITIYQDKMYSRTTTTECLVDVVYLEPSDATELACRGRLTMEALERRGSTTIALADILNDTCKQEHAAIIETNEVKEKLSWIRAVVGCWVKEGGVGRMGEERLGWSGLQEKREPGKSKLSWVTVGRLGGDGGV